MRFGRAIGVERITWPSLLCFMLDSAALNLRSRVSWLTLTGAIAVMLQVAVKRGNNSSFTYHRGLLDVYEGGGSRVGAMYVLRA